MTILGYKCRSCGERFTYADGGDITDAIGHIDDEHDSNCSFDVLTDHEVRH